MDDLFENHANRDRKNMIDPIPILEISTNAGCVMNCNSYCPQSVHVNSYVKNVMKPPINHGFIMQTGVFEKCLETVPREVEIQFAGMSEPWINPNATEMVIRASRKGHHVSIFSTLFKMTLDDVAELRKTPWRIFCVHLPDAEGQMHLKITDEYLKVLSAVAELSPSYMIVGTMPDAVREIVGQSVPDHNHRLYSRAGNIPDRAIPRKTGKLKELPCMHHGVLLPNGDVVLCCQDYAIKSVLGNLTRHSYESLYTGEEFKRVLRGLDDENEDIICRNCEVAECA